MVTWQVDEVLAASRGRHGMKTNPRPAWGADGPHQPASEAVSRYVLGAAVWAPSVHNTQPWAFAVREREISLYADPGRQLLVTDPGGREMMISCGAALFTVRLALRSLSFIPIVTLLPDPGRPLLVARVTWRHQAPPAPYEQRLFGQVLRRRTHRGGFAPLPLAKEFLAGLCRGAERDGATLRIIADPGERAVLATAVRDAERALRLDSAHVAELAAWASPPGSARPDGVPPTAYPARAERTSPDFPGRDFAHGCGWGLPTFSTRAGRSAPGVVCVLTTRGDRPVDWVGAGQALQRILLGAAAGGVAAALHSQPFELPELREFIRARLGDGSHPQLILRLGTVIQTGASVRRPLSSVLLRDADRVGAARE
jgi:nitroreductase